MHRKTAYFLSGLRVFWRTEMLVVLRFIAQITWWIILCAALLLAYSGAYAGFYLTHQPQHTPYSMVWMGRCSAMLWVVFLCFLLVRHIIRIGEKAAKEDGITHENE